jgi:carboxyl-terminal processing protease
VDGIPVTADMSSDAVIALVRGAVGTTVTLGIRRPGATPPEQIIEVTRQEIQTPSFEWRLLDSDPDTAHIGYLRQTIFSERSASEMERALAELVEAGADRFIWDLRGNPGGLVDAATATASLWLDGGGVLIEEHADGTRKVLTAQDGGPATGYPLVVIVDGGSASASEIVAGALQDHGRARLVGERTFGKGSVQLIYELRDQSSLHVTNAQWFTPNRRQISGDGLAPDIAVEPGTDPLPAAIAAVLNQGVRVEPPVTPVAVPDPSTP